MERSRKRIRTLIENEEYPYIHQVEEAVLDQSEKKEKADARENVPKFSTQEEKDTLQFQIDFSEHSVLSHYDKEKKTFTTEKMSFAVANRLLVILDEQESEKQKGEEESFSYYKTAFSIYAVIDGEEYSFRGRYDICSEGKSLLDHIKEYYEYCLSPDCLYRQFWEEDGTLEEKIDQLTKDSKVFLPYLEEHVTLTVAEQKQLEELLNEEEPEELQEKKYEIVRTERTDFPFHVQELIREGADFLYSGNNMFCRDIDEAYVWIEEQKKAVELTEVAIENSEEYEDIESSFVTAVDGEGHRQPMYRLLKRCNEGLEPYSERIFDSRGEAEEYIQNHSDEIKEINYDEIINWAAKIGKDRIAATQIQEEVLETENIPITPALENGTSRSRFFIFYQKIPNVKPQTDISRLGRYHNVVLTYYVQKKKRRLKKMRNLSKIATAALAVAMVATSAVPTFAYDKTPDQCYEHSYEIATVEKDHLHETCAYCGDTRDVYFTKDASECTHENVEEFNYTPSTCTQDGRDFDEICVDCGTVVKEGEVTPASGHRRDADDSDIISEKLATCTEDGEITAKCIICDEVFTEVTPALGHQWDNETVTKEPTKTEAGERTYTCNRCGETMTEEIPKLSDTEEPSTEPEKPSTEPEKPSTEPEEPTTEGKKDDTQPSTDKKDETKPSTEKNDTTTGGTTKPAKKEVAKVGTKFVVSGQTYKVTKIGKEVSFIATKKNAKSVSIPATVKSKGITYKVTSIAAKAVKSNKKAKSITIGANVSKIASNAFYKCPNVKTITIKSTKLTKKTASKKMVSGLNKKLVVKVPKKVKKSYTKIFKRLKIK